jgi:hypothetical protein
MVKPFFKLPFGAIIEEPLYIPPKATLVMGVDRATPGNEYQSKVTMMKNKDGTITVTDIETVRIYDVP